MELPLCIVIGGSISVDFHAVEFGDCMGSMNAWLREDCLLGTEGLLFQAVDVGDCILAGVAVVVLCVGTSLCTSIGGGIVTDRSGSFIAGAASPLPTSTSIPFFLASLAFRAAS